MKRYQVYYRGKLAIETNIHSKAQSTAFQLCKDKGWAIADVEIKDLLMGLKTQS